MGKEAARGGSQAAANGHTSIDTAGDGRETAA